MKIIGTNDNMNEATENLDFSNLLSINANESKLAFDAAIGDMEHESSMEWSDEYLSPLD